jgi:hypothetical protein
MHGTQPWKQAALHNHRAACRNKPITHCAGCSVWHRQKSGEHSAGQPGGDRAPAHMRRRLGTQARLQQAATFQALPVGGPSMHML